MCDLTRKYEYKKTNKKTHLCANLCNIPIKQGTHYACATFLVHKYRDFTINSAAEQKIFDS